MIKKCNFKRKIEHPPDYIKGDYICVLGVGVSEYTRGYSKGIIKREIEEYHEHIQSLNQCVGEDNCILFQTYKELMKRKNVLDEAMDLWRA